MNLTQEVVALMIKARHALEVSEKLQAGGDFPDAAGKAYQAMFYAAQALLKAHSIEVVKHSAVASMLGSHFAKAGRLDPKFHRMFLNARRVREIADYGIFEEIIEPTANLTVEEARAFVGEISRILHGEQKQNYRLETFASISILACRQELYPDPKLITVAEILAYLVGDTVGD